MSDSTSKEDIKKKNRSYQSTGMNIQGGEYNTYIQTQKPTEFDLRNKQ